MTDRIADLRKMVADATPGPWVEFFKDDGGKWTGWPISIEAVSFTDKVVVRPGGQWPYDWDAGVSQNEAIANARLIAQAPTLATDLADALEREAKLREALTKATNRLEWCSGILPYETNRNAASGWVEEARAALGVKP